ncbi:hypothetical protein CISG_05761 [Coccidioides immitis RMSCC 3703]|uniref:Uncharacterized protein n=1 Tax=Coccidioides immitis RMSCC 3703 TaxID=454286 RepID=A0A0J8QZ25_COCIT|nr:hypothetical protein CISG_05761 [Coccidioides immitis RMSCC 3703]
MAVSASIEGPDQPRFSARSHLGSPKIGGLIQKPPEAMRTEKVSPTVRLLPATSDGTVETVGRVPARGTRKMAIVVVGDWAGDTENETPWRAGQRTRWTQFSFACGRKRGKP